MSLAAAAEHEAALRREVSGVTEQLAYKEEAVAVLSKEIALLSEELHDERGAREVAVGLYEDELAAAAAAEGVEGQRLAEAARREVEQHRTAMDEAVGAARFQVAAAAAREALATREKEEAAASLANLQSQFHAVHVQVRELVRPIV